MKLSKGLGVASAYYLVYTQHTDKDTGEALRDYRLSTDDGYGKDVYSSYIPKEVAQQIVTDNHQLYHDIQAHKATGFISKVIDNYIKRF